jgi:hypothetical protein
MFRVLPAIATGINAFWNSTSVQYCVFLHHSPFFGGSEKKRLKKTKKTHVVAYVYFAKFEKF